MRALLLPCETRSREFDAKLLLACRAAARGIETWVGAKKVLDLQLDRLPPAVYVGKSVTARTTHNFQIARKAGHRLAAWDEEGLVWSSREVYWRTKVGAEALALPELLLAWGEENARAWKDFPGYAGNPVAVTGNPRADLLASSLRGYFREEADRIRSELGPFILVNTNFSRVNHVQPRQNRHLKWLRENRPDDPRGGFAAHKFELFNAFQEMLPALATAVPDATIVIRPHPSERIETWQALASRHANVRVHRQGNVIPWLLASHGVIHNGCTTAVEGFMLERPGLAWMPVRSPDFDHPLPNGISLQFDLPGDLAAAVSQCLDDPASVFARQVAEGRQTLLDHNVAPGEGLAADRILDALAPLLKNEAPPSGAQPWLAPVLLAGRRMFRRLEHRLPGQGNSQDYLQHMFPHTSQNDVSERIRRFDECLGGMGGVQSEAVLPGVFRVHAASPTV